MYLPNELWYNILDFLSVEDKLISARAVCKSWHDYIINNPYLIIDKDMDFKLLQIINKEKVKFIYFRDLSLAAHKLSYIFKRFKQVEKLYLIELDSWWSCYINIVLLKNLKTLYIKGSILSIRYALTTIGLRCNNLKELIIKDNHFINAYTLQWLIVNMIYLERIRIINCRNIDNFTINIFNNFYESISISD